MLRVGMDLLRRRKRGLQSVNGEKGDGNGKERANDLLSVLVKANQDVGLPEAQRMSDEEVIARECCSI